MRLWKPYRFSLLAIVSLALLVLVAILFWRSTRHGDVAVLFGPRGMAQGIFSLNRKILILTSNVPVAGNAYRVAAGSVSIAEGASQWGELQTSLLMRKRFGPFEWWRGNGAFGHAEYWYTGVVLPHWAFALLAVLLPAQWFRSEYRHWRWRRTGRCLHCGYDLRESPERCPECGQPAHPA